ncbi:B-lymphocyte antigen CD20 isoform X3 [Cavia porcellus]|uniref:B-lymphocyte antigen CD20 isoform X3 n=1 Tax=Cavia porcellus TaxID=10141 RepID=UPI0006618BB0
MTAPQNSTSGAFPVEPSKGPISKQAAPEVNFRRMLSTMGPTQSFFMRESKALGFIISGSLLVAAEKTSRNSLVRVKVIMNSLTLFAAISGIILLIMDIFNIKLSHFLKMERLSFIKTPVTYINIYNCEPAIPSKESLPSTQYCYTIQSVFLGILSVMLIFAFFQKLVAAGIVENEWKRLCSRPKASMVLLATEEKKEQTAEIKEEIVELIEVSSQPKTEEEIEIIPVQEEEEETEVNFPEPPQDHIQESFSVENDICP